MIPNFSQWKIYQNGVLRLTVDSVAIPTDLLKGSLFYFEVTKGPKSNFGLGEQIQLVTPPGVPIYLCRVAGLAEKPDDSSLIQIQAALVSVVSSP